MKGYLEFINEGSMDEVLYRAQQMAKRLVPWEEFQLGSNDRIELDLVDQHKIKRKLKELSKKYSLKLTTEFSIDGDYLYKFDDNDDEGFDTAELYKNPDNVIYVIGIDTEYYKFIDTNDLCDNMENLMNIK